MKTVHGQARHRPDLPAFLNSAVLRADKLAAAERTHEQTAIKLMAAQKDEATALENVAQQRVEFRQILHDAHVDVADIVSMADSELTAAAHTVAATTARRAEVRHLGSESSPYTSAEKAVREAEQRLRSAQALTAALEMMRGSK